MRRRGGAWILFAAFATVWSLGPLSARAGMIYSRGHGDIGVLFEDGELELHYHFDASSMQEASGGGLEPIVPPGTVDPEAFEFSPDGIFVRVPDPPISRPAGAQWDFLGTPAGGDVWFLPQSSSPVKPFLGIASEDLDPADWVGGITWALTAATMPLGGEFALWQTDFFGNPIRFWDTRDGSFLNDAFGTGVGGHDHYNYGFTAPGVYELQLTATGTHTSFGTVSDTETFTFLVGNATVVPTAVPEPSSLALLGLAGAGAVGGRLVRRRKHPR